MENMMTAQPQPIAAPQDPWAGSVTLDIGGHEVEVGKDFLSLSPEQQNKTVEEIVHQMGIQAAEQESPQSQDLRSDLSSLTQGGQITNPEPKDSGGMLQSIDSGMRGAADMMTFGLADEIAGVGNAVAKSLNPFNDYSKMAFPSISDEIQKEREKQAYRDEANPIASTVGRAAGGITQGVGMAKNGLSLLANAPRGAGVMNMTGRGALEGAGYGAAYGLGSGEGITDRLQQGVQGAASGAAIGGAIPLVGAGFKAAAKPITDAIGARINPEAFADRKIVERLANAGMTVEQAANKVAAGDRATIADVGGKQVRNLLRTVANIPGKAQDRIGKMLTMRQFGQGDRLKDVVKDVFADPDGFMTAGDKLAKSWSEAGNGLYEPALAKKVVWTDRLKQFVDEPIFKRSLAQGVKIQRLEALAEGKPFNPTDYAIIGFNEAGDPIIGGVPNMRTLNVAKKGLDAIIGDMKNPLTGKLTEEGRATDMVRRAFVEQIDSWNPEYKQARSVWGGFAKVKEAMLFGQNDALNMSPEAVARSFKDMAVSEQQAARIGLADALRKRIDAAGFGHNAILKIFGNRQTVGVLKAAFPNQESFAAFRKAIFTEARKRATYEAVKGNSTSVAQLADMAESGGLQEGFNAAKTAVTQGPVSATLQWVGSRLKMLGGMTPEVADSIGRKLMSADPATVRQIALELRKIEVAGVSSQQKARLVQSTLGRVLSLPAQLAGQPQSQPPALSAP